MKRREFYLELSRKLQNGETVKVRTDLEKGSHSFEEPGEGTFFEEEFAGRTQVVVFGGGHISLALEKVLKTLDLTLTVVDDRLEFANRERFSEADRVLTMSYEKLSEVDLNKSVSQEGYKRELAAKQAELAALHNRVYRSRKPVVVVYEGWDAAGKGGNIRRVTDALDPRGYEVIPIASPEPHEKARHYLWRFWTHLPKDGHIALFDRSWYGRVMVERIEGFCSQNDWQRAYREINEFEQELTAWGAVVVKFWVHIDQATQLARFTERQDTPEKRWKITDEDWRNREKWPAYEKAADEMLKKTSTDFAPWHILESNDKRYARLKALDILIREIRRGLLAGK